MSESNKNKNKVYTFDPNAYSHSIKIPCLYGICRGHVKHGSFNTWCRQCLKYEDGRTAMLKDQNRRLVNDTRYIIRHMY